MSAWPLRCRGDEVEVPRLAVRLIPDWLREKIEGSADASRDDPSWMSGYKTVRVTHRQNAPQWTPAAIAESSLEGAPYTNSMGTPERAFFFKRIHQQFA